jgi:hypothetical protein
MPPGNNQVSSNICEKDPGGGGRVAEGVGKCLDDDCNSKYIAAVHHLRNLKLDKKLLLGEEELGE